MLSGCNSSIVRSQQVVALPDDQLAVIFAQIPNVRPALRALDDGCQPRVGGLFTHDPCFVYEIESPVRRLPEFAQLAVRETPNRQVGIGVRMDISITYRIAAACIHKLPIACVLVEFACRAGQNGTSAVIAPHMMRM